MWNIQEVGSHEHCPEGCLEVNHDLGFAATLGHASCEEIHSDDADDCQDFTVNDTLLVLVLAGGVLEAERCDVGKLV